MPLILFALIIKHCSVLLLLFAKYRDINLRLYHPPLAIGMAFFLV